MKSTRCAAPLAAAAMLALAACGGGGGTQPATSMPEPTTSAPELEVRIPAQLPLHASQSPVVGIGDRLHVGANVAPPNNFRETFAAPQVVQGIDIYRGRVASEVTTTEMIGYLRHDYYQGGSHSSGNVQRFGAVPPVINLGITKNG